MSLINQEELCFGSIICSVILVDCIYMTEEYVNDMRKNNYLEYVCGDYKEGRYAWILSDVKVLDSPIEVKGHLGIWNLED